MRILTIMALAFLLTGCETTMDILRAAGQAGAKTANENAWRWQVPPPTVQPTVQETPTCYAAGSAEGEELNEERGCY
jgi:hypothetical protein